VETSTKDGQNYSEQSFQMIVALSVENSAMHNMLREYFCTDRKAAMRYNQFRSQAISELKQNLGSDLTSELIDLREKVSVLESQNAFLSEQLEYSSQKEAKLQEEYSKSNSKYNRLWDLYGKLANILMAYTQLSKWYGRLVAEVPQIRKRNSGLIRGQTWEGAVEEYERNSMRPQIPPFDPVEFGLERYFD
jgi:hypothetical protein